MEPLLTLLDLLKHEIDDLSSAEEQIVDALPKMLEKATSRELKDALQDHLSVTQRQQDRLEQVRTLVAEHVADNKKKLLGKLFGGNTKCKGMEGLIAEGQKMISQNMDLIVRDAAIIGAAQKIEHYEIAGYGTARAYASELGLTEVETLLEVNLHEEYETDDALTALAVRLVNVAADKGNVPGPDHAAKKSTRSGSAGTAKKTSRASSPRKKAAPKKASAKAAKKKSSE